MSKKIMIVEDEVSFQKFYSEILEEIDCEITRVYNGTDALEKLEKTRPDLIILDMLLDIIKGDTLFMYLKSMSEYANIPIIIVSNCPQRDYEYLKEIDPDLVYLDKYNIGDTLITAIKDKIG